MSSNPTKPVIYNPIAILQEQENNKNSIQKGDMLLQTVEHLKKMTSTVRELVERVDFLEEQVAKSQTQPPTQKLK